ncbi:MAG: HEPN domain-containing protein [Chloroflexota bacterium]|nr:HEPN domain-containing protein [Chloroflexota bacterium]
MDVLDEARRWLEEAKYDLQTATDVLKAGRYNWACFIAQQAAEKAVKSLHIARGEDVEHTHSVTILIAGDERRGVSSLEAMRPVLTEAQELDGHYIPSRYPNSVPFGQPYEFYNEEKGERCVTYAQRIVEAAQTSLRRSSVG